MGKASALGLLFSGRPTAGAEQDRPYGWLRALLGPRSPGLVALANGDKEAVDEPGLSPG